MYKFFQVPIISGFLFVVLSLSLYLRKTIAQIECLKKIITNLQEPINVAWVFCLVFFISSSYRLIKLVLQIAFFESTDEEAAENEELEYDVEEYNQVKETYAITKEKQDDSWENVDET